MVKRKNGVFNDPTTEINQLATRIKGDTKFLKLELDDLQLYLEHHKRLVGSGSAAAADHSQSVVETMQYQLVNTATHFKEVLEVLLRRISVLLKIYTETGKTLSKQHGTGGIFSVGTMTTTLLVAPFLGNRRRKRMKRMKGCFNQTE